MTRPENFQANQPHRTSHAITICPELFKGPVCHFANIHLHAAHDLNKQREINSVFPANTHGCRLNRIRVLKAFTQPTFPGLELFQPPAIRDTRIIGNIIHNTTKCIEGDHVPAALPRQAGKGKGQIGLCPRRNTSRIRISFIHAHGQNSRLLSLRAATDKINDPGKAILNTIQTIIH